MTVVAEQEQQLSSGIGCELLQSPIAKYERTVIDTMRRNQSKQVDVFERAFDLRQADIIPPPYNPLEIAYFKLNNIWHGACLETKATVSTQEFNIVGRDGAKISKGKAKRCRAILDSLYSEGDTHSDFASYLKCAAMDLANQGLSNKEILRDRNGKPARAFHMPSITMRKASSLNGWFQMSLLGNQYTNDGGDGTGRNLTHLMNSSIVNQGLGVAKKVYFKPYGDEREFDIHGRPLSSRTNNKLRANEVIVSSQYDSASPFYGVPPWLASLTHILSDESAIQWNLSFFRNHRVPDFIIKIIGNKMKEKEKDDVKYYFAKRAQAHVPMLINVPAGENAAIEIEKLTQECREGEFIKLQEHMRDAICSAHRTPLQILGIQVSGSLGGGGSDKEQRRNYKTLVVEPMQKQLVAPVNNLLLPDLGFGDCLVEMKPFDTSDADEFKLLSESCRENVKSAVMTVNEARQKIGLPRIDKPWADKHFVFQGNEIVDMENISGLIDDSIESREVAADLASARKMLRSSK